MSEISFVDDGAEQPMPPASSDMPTSPASDKFSKSVSGSGNFGLGAISGIFSNPIWSNPALHLFLYFFCFLFLIFLVTNILLGLFVSIDSLQKAANFETGFVLPIGRTNPIGLLTSVFISVTLPFYLFFSYLINRLLFKVKIATVSKVRKNATYTMLSFVLVITVGAFMWLLYHWLNGDIGAAYLILKIVITLVAAGSISSYYLWNIRKESVIGRRYLWDGIFMSFVVLAALLASRYIYFMAYWRGGY
jgi:hypothetical protein